MTTYYRTGKGHKRHASVYCANARRAIRTGDPLVIPAAEVQDWLPCRFCCNAEEIAAEAPAAPVAAPVEQRVMCPNSGISRPGSRRLYDKCSDCGKEGAVGKNGRIRAHEAPKGSGDSRGKR
jgi:hypothetical protein